MQRERLGSRLGFILLSAGCAIGVGNVWKFPWMVGQYGGGAFVLCYVIFLLILGLPIMTMEFAVGRASQKSPVRAYQALEKPGSKWHIHGYLSMVGNYLLMMFYTTVCGWMLHYFYLTASGRFIGADTEQVSAAFGEMLSKPGVMAGCMIAVVVVGAMNQAFFTLSLGIGAMAIFGSYIGKGRALMGEAVNVAVLDTFVAFTAGLIIFPACFAFNVSPDSGPNLIFVTLPNIFNHMAGGRLWGSLFFVFMAFAAFSTVLAVFENIMSCCMDLTGWSRRKTATINIVLMILLSLPCVLGFNVWSGFQPFGPGSNVLDLEDFLVSNLWLPLGSLVYLLFCTSRYGWGWEKFKAEANEGGGLKVRDGIRFYVSYILPIIVLVIFVLGIKDKFFLSLSKS